jgi:squalene-associated FAD-dependent desaturase
MAAGHVAVVGAGLAGLAAGLDLTDAGFEVEIFERGRLLGGRATSFVVDDIEIDNGQHVFLACCTEFLRFVDRVGMSGAMHMQDRFDALVLSRNGVTSRLRAVGLPSPWHLLGSFLGYRHLDWPSKLRVAQALRDTSSAARSDGTFAEWLASHHQTEGSLRSFWRPFFVPALNAPLEEVSASDAGFVLSTAFLNDAESSRFGYATVPLAHVAGAAATRVADVHLSTPVAGLLLSHDGSKVSGLELANGGTREFDGVVIAVPPPQLARLVDGVRTNLPNLDGFIPHPIVDAHLWHDRGSLGFDFAALLDSPVQWIFEKAPGYLCCSVSAAERYLNLPTTEVAAECWSEVSQSVPELKHGTLVRSVVTRNPEATYLPSPGQARPPAATAIPNVAIAGSWTDTGWPDTMESAVRSGRSAAGVLKKALGGVAVA